MNDQITTSLVWGMLRKYCEKNAEKLMMFNGGLAIKDVRAIASKLMEIGISKTDTVSLSWSECDNHPIFSPWNHVTVYWQQNLCCY